MPLTPKAHGLRPRLQVLLVPPQPVGEWCPVYAAPCTAPKDCCAEALLFGSSLSDTTFAHLPTFPTALSFQSVTRLESHSAQPSGWAPFIIIRTEGSSVTFQRAWQLNIPLSRCTRVCLSIQPGEGHPGCFHVLASGVFRHLGGRSGVESCFTNSKCARLARKHV